MSSSWFPVALAVILVGCSLADDEILRRQDSVGIPSSSTFDKWVRQNPCGALTVQRPLLNASGRVGGRVTSGQWVHLYIAPNLTRGAARFVVGNCASLGRVPVNRSGGFELLSLPEGKFVAATNSPGKDSHMIVHEYNRSGYHIRQDDAFLEEDRLLFIFSIQPTSPARKLPSNGH